MLEEKDIEDLLYELEDKMEELEGEYDFDFVPTGKQVADTAYLAWESEGELTAEKLDEKSQELGMDMSEPQITAAMNYLEDQGLVDLEPQAYNVGESQELKDPNPSIINRALSPLTGSAFLEDPYKAFIAVGEAQEEYPGETKEDPGLNRETAGLYPGVSISPDQVAEKEVEYSQEPGRF